MPGGMPVGGAVVPQMPTLYKPRALPGAMLALGLILLAAFADSIPLDYIIPLRSAPGRILLFGGALAILVLAGPAFGLLAAIAALMLYQAALYAPHAEGYSDYEYRKYHTKRRWFVEEVLGEKPVAMATDKVQTIQI